VWKRWTPRQGPSSIPSCTKRFSPYLPQRSTKGASWRPSSPATCSKDRSFAAARSPSPPVPHRSSRLSTESLTKDKRPLEVRILVSGRDPGLPVWVRKGLDGIAYRAEFSESLPDPSRLSAESDFRPDLALIDEENSPEFPARLRAFKEAFPQCQLLLLGREESSLTPRAIRPVAVRHWFYRPFPPQELERILGAAGRSLQRQWREEHRHTRSLSGFEGLVGHHPKLIEALEMARRVAASPRTTVLILGETGTGKGLLAKAIHTESPRNTGPFIEVNCGVMPPNLMESELFGHVKGAFTSAVSDKPGLLELR